MEQFFPESPEKEKTLLGVPKFSEIIYQEIPFHWPFLTKFPDFLIEWFAFRKFNYTVTIPTHFVTIQLSH